MGAGLLEKIHRQKTQEGNQVFMDIGEIVEVERVKNERKEERLEVVSSELADDKEKKEDVSKMKQLVIDDVG